MEAVCSVVLITILESDQCKSPPLVAVAYISSNKLRFSSVRVRYGTLRSIAYMLRSSVRSLIDRQSIIVAIDHIDS